MATGAVSWMGSTAKGRTSAAVVSGVGSRVRVFSLAVMAGSMFFLDGWRLGHWLDHRCCGLLAFAEPRRLVQQDAQTLRGRLSP